MLTWFPVHPVSMNNSNRLLTSDNKGMAQQWVEKRWATHQQDMESGFTAAFAQSNSECRHGGGTGGVQGVCGMTVLERQGRQKGVGRLGKSGAVL